MAKYLSNIDLSRNELQNAVVHPLATAPGTATQGQIYFDTSTGDKHLYLYNGTQWVQLSEDINDANDFLTGLSFNTSDGVLTGTVSNQADVTVDLDGRYALSSSIGDGTLTVNGTGVLGGTGTFTANQAGNTTINISHDNTSRTDTTSADSPASGGTFTAVQSVTTNATGHVTAIDVSTVTLPVDPDNYVDSLGFSGGVLTLGRTGALADLTQDLDGRYLELIGGTMSGDIAMGANKVTGLATPTANSDAATKEYVDNLVDGGLTFKDGFNATTGAIDGGGNLTSGATRVALSVGDYYVVTTAGDFYNDSSYPLTVGDSVIAKEDAAAGASVVTDWVIIQGDEGVIDLTSGNGGTSTGNALTSNTNQRGAVTVNSFAYGGTTNVGHVPSGGSGTTFLRGDGTWVVPTNTEGVTSIATSAPITGGTITDTGTIGISNATALAVGAARVTAGTGISVSVSSGNFTVTNTERNSQNTFAATISDTATVTHNLGAKDVIVQLYDTVTAETVYADVERASTNTVTVTFASTPTNDIRVLVQKIG